MFEPWICEKKLDPSQVPCKGKGLSWNLSPWGNSASSVQSRHPFIYKMKMHIWDTNYLAWDTNSSWYQIRYTWDIHEICFGHLLTTDDLVDELKHMNFRGRYKWTVHETCIAEWKLQGHNGKNAVERLRSWIYHSFNPPKRNAKKPMFCGFRLRQS